MSQADALKALGNECFAKGKIDAAIDAYSEAICLDPRNPIYHTNRAMCYRKKEAWDQVLRDCSAAIAIDALSIKAHYFLGAALIEQGSYPDGIANLRRALDLCRDKTVSYKDDIRKTLLSARKRQDAAKWPSTRQLAAAESLVPQLLRNHFESQGISAADPDAAGVVKLAEDGISSMRQVRAPSVVPDHLCCKISMELMLDPVITPSGISYERSCLREHLSRVGAFDPVTRSPLSIEQVTPNLALKEIIEQFVEERPWAYEGSL